MSLHILLKVLSVQNKFTLNILWFFFVDTMYSGVQTRDIVHLENGILYNIQGAVV